MPYKRQEPSKDTKRQLHVIWAPRLESSHKDVQGYKNKQKYARRKRS